MLILTAPLSSLAHKLLTGARHRGGRYHIGLSLLAIAVVLVACTLWDSSGSQDPYRDQAQRSVAPERFDIFRWEVSAISSELAESVFYSQVDPADPRAQSLVLAYLDRAQRIGELGREVEQAAAQTKDEGQRSIRLASTLDELEKLRTWQAKVRPLVEHILEAQVAAVIREQHAGWLGLALPPPAFDFTEPPNYLVLSPRDKIELRLGIYLIPTLSLETIEAIETRLENEIPNTSALISGTGGFSSWPTMIVDQASLEWILSTIAHEWVHVYLAPYPLGRHYYANQDTTAINETTAQIAGDELGRLALERYYPQLVETTGESAKPADRSDDSSAGEQGFDFNREMRITRETVDQLLAQGEVEKAEAYMEERRQFFVENGHFIRRLNQAYFAFHGTYRTGPAAPAEDPIAPRLRRLRQESSNLAAFLEEVRDMDSLDDLIARVPEP
ncbi:MAG: hypothetical protein ACUVWR_05070 [Anaerolineae bacterium]